MLTMRSGLQNVVPLVLHTVPIGAAGTIVGDEEVDMRSAFAVADPNCRAVRPVLNAPKKRIPSASAGRGQSCQRTGRGGGAGLPQ